MNDNIKFVRFDLWCKKCTHWNESEAGDNCHYCLNEPVNYASTKPLNFEENISYKEVKPTGYYDNIRKVKKYLYYTEYSTLDYNYAKDYYRTKKDITQQPIACSSVRKGPLYGRKLDWTYNRNAEFVVRTKNSIGISGGFAKLTNDYVGDGDFDDLYRVVPFQMYDGINKSGVFANMNVVPTDKGYNDSIPLIEQRDEICNLMLIRYILDNFTSAQEAVNYIRDYVSVYFTKSTHDYGYETHYMIGDSNSTYVLEFVNHQAVIINVTNNAYLTNFYIDGVTFNQDGSVYTPETQDDIHNAIVSNGVTPLGSGLERYNLINDAYATLDTLSDMRSLMNRLKYTRAYSMLVGWYTEFVGNRGLTVVSQVYEYIPVMKIAEENFRTRNRLDNRTWHSVHSSIYNIVTKELYLVTQEDNIELYFKL